MHVVKREKCKWRSINDIDKLMVDQSTTKYMGQCFMNVWGTRINVEKLSEKRPHANMFTVAINLSAKSLSLTSAFVYDPPPMSD